MCIYIYIHAYIHMYVCMYVCIYIYIYVQSPKKKAGASCGIGAPANPTVGQGVEIEFGTPDTLAKAPGTHNSY